MSQKTTHAPCTWPQHAPSASEYQSPVAAFSVSPALRKMFGAHIGAQVKAHESAHLLDANEEYSDTRVRVSIFTTI